MKIEVEIKNLTKISLNRELIKKTACQVINGEASDGRDIEVSVVIVGGAKIRRINKEYRKIDAVTDVLSFAEQDLAEKQAEYPRILGELIICQKQVKADAKEAGVSEKRELVWVVIHGILHLFGYAHETNEAEARMMREKEEFYLSKIKFKSAKLKAQSVK